MTAVGTRFLHPHSRLIHAFSVLKNEMTRADELAMEVGFLARTHAERRRARGSGVRVPGDCLSPSPYCLPRTLVRKATVPEFLEPEEATPFAVFCLRSQSRIWPQQKSVFSCLQGSGCNRVSHHAKAAALYSLTDPSEARLLSGHRLHAPSREKAQRSTVATQFSLTALFSEW